MFSSTLSDWLWVVDFAIQATLILAVAALVDWFLSIRNRTVDSAAVWPACIIALLALPVLTFMVPKQATLFRVTSFHESVKLTDVEVAKDTTDEATTAPIANRNTTKPVSIRNAADSSVGSNSGTALATLPPSQPVSSISFGWLDLTIGTICLIYLWMSFRFIVSIVGVKSLKRNALVTKHEEAISIFSAQVSKLDISSPQTLLQSDEIRVPMVAGILCPQVVVPTDVIHDTSHESSAQLEAIFIHELTHIKRRDPIWNFLLELTTVIYWFHPIMWFARSRFADLRERACDDYCIHRIGETKAYCDTLIAIASRLTRPLNSNANLSLAVIRRPKLAKRITDINKMDGNEKFNSSFTIRTLLAIALMLTTVTVTTVSTFADSQQDNQSTAEYYASFTSKEKAMMAKLLANDQKEVKDKSTVLKMLVKKNLSNLERIKTWEGTFSYAWGRLAEGEKGTHGIRGRFSIDNEHNQIFWDGAGPPANGMTSRSVISGEFDPRSFKSITGPMSGQGIAANLSLAIKNEPIPGFWDRARLTISESENGKTYSFRTCSVIISDRKEHWIAEYVFEESAGYMVVSYKNYFSKLDLDQLCEVEYQNVGGIFIPKKHTFTSTGGFGKLDVRDVATTELFLSRLNKGLTFHHLYETYRDDLKNDPKAKAKKGNIAVGPHIDWDSTPNFVQTINQDRIELRANKDGSLAAIVSISEHGEMARYSDTKAFRKQLESFSRKLPAEVAARMRLVFATDMELNPAELERFKSEIQIEIKLNGRQKTIPTITVL